VCLVPELASVIILSDTVFHFLHYPASDVFIFFHSIMRHKRKQKWNGEYYKEQSESQIIRCIFFCNNDWIRSC
jgi:hypothetical protein